MEEDRISELPDDIIIANIISRLTLKEAAATSLISTRWTDLWKFYSGFFDFDGSHTLRGFGKQLDISSSLFTERRLFVDWVNHVFQSHQGGTMERLRVIFDAENSSLEVIDTWVQLALAKRVQFIELDLASLYSQPPIEYNFTIRSHCGLQSLKSLVLEEVNISGDALESLVDKCPNLEELSITASNFIEVFKLSSLSLKQLSMWHTAQVCKISAPNLLSLVWAGSENSNLVLQDVPQLKYVRLSVFWHHIQSHHSQFVTLELDYIFLGIPGNFNTTELSILRHLRMKHRCIDERTFHLTVAYLKAAPLLENFTLEVYWPLQTTKLTETALNMIENHCYKNLKTVEFKGFGVTNDEEFITRLVNHAPLLEKIIIVPWPANDMLAMRGDPVVMEYKQSTTYLKNRDRAINFSASLSCQVIVV